jgi:hypothetical protein
MGKVRGIPVHRNFPEAGNLPILRSGWRITGRSCITTLICYGTGAPARRNRSFQVAAGTAW